MTEPLNNVRTIDLGDEKVELDPKRLQFNDASLGQFMEELSVWYDYYSSKAAKAEELFVKAESRYESKRAEKFLAGKSQEGLSDKAAEAYAATSLEVEAAKEVAQDMKSAVKQLKDYLRAFDKAHDCAQNRGYMLRKEMDKLQFNIPGSSGRKEINVDDILGKIDNGKI